LQNILLAAFYYYVHWFFTIKCK